MDSVALRDMHEEVLSPAAGVTLLPIIMFMPLKTGLKRPLASRCMFWKQSTPPRK